MAEIRFNYGDKFTQTTDTNTGIGSTIPTVKLDVVGGASAGSLRVSGIATIPSYQGFVNTKLTIPTEGMIVEAGQSGSVSGEVVVSTGQTISISTGATTGQGGVQSLKVYETFMPPVGGTADRPTDVKPGMVYYNKDFKTIEFWDGNFWKQVDNTTRSGRGLFGGGQPGPSSKIDSIEIMSQGNGVDFGSLINANANKMAFANSTRGIFVGGSSSGTDMDYVTIASRGNGIDFGNLTQDRAYGGGASSSTRGLAIGGWAGSNPPSNVIDYVEIMTIGNALDFGDLFTGRYNHSSFSSPTRAFAYAGVNNNNGTSEISIEVVTIASKGNATDFGDAAARANATLCGSSSPVRGIMGGGMSGPTYLNLIQYLTMSSSGSAQIFGELTSARQRPGGASTHTRSVFYGGRTDGNDYTIIDFITIATTGNAQDFGDVNDEDNYTKAGCSDSHGGLGGF